jgi:hypothetical protein
VILPPIGLNNQEALNIFTEASALRSLLPGKCPAANLLLEVLEIAAMSRSAKAT